MAKAALIYAGVNYLGKTLSKMAELTRMSAPAASKARTRAAASGISIDKLIS
jgi:hypothetical protein